MKKSEFNKVIDAYILREKEGIKEHYEIREILLPLEGKIINGRTLNSKVLGKFKLRIEYGLIYIDGNFSHLIGYTNSSENTVQVTPTDKHRGFDYLDACYGRAAEERIKNTELGREKAYPVFRKISKCFEELQKAFGDVEREKLHSFHFAPYYNLLRAINEDKPDQIRLSDFYYLRK
jgi:hypothetical protein